MDKFISVAFKYSEHIISSFLIVIAVYLLKLIITKIFEGRIQGIRKRYLFRQTVAYIAYILIFFAIIVIWFEWLSNFLTFLSLVTGAIIITSKEIVQNLFANIVIISRELFQVGDRIQIGNSIGDVIETGPLYVTLTELTISDKGEEPTGRIIKVPNNFVFSQTLANYSKGVSVIWNELSISISYKSDIEEIKRIFLQAAAKFSFKFDEKSLNLIKEKHGDLMFMNTEPKVFIFPEDKKIRFTLRYPCKFFKKRESENEIYEYVLNEFKKSEVIDYYENN